MTLLKMIKKYEGIKEKMRAVHARADEETVEAILEDLKSVRDQQPSWVTVRDKIMKKIDIEIENGGYDAAATLAHTLRLLPD